MKNFSSFPIPLPSQDIFRYTSSLVQFPAELFHGPIRRKRSEAEAKLHGKLNYFDVFPSTSQWEFDLVSVAESKKRLFKFDSNHILTVLFTLSISIFTQEDTRDMLTFHSHRSQLSAERKEKKLCLVDFSCHYYLLLSTRLPSPSHIALCKVIEKPSYSDIDCERVQKNIINYRLTFPSFLASCATCGGAMTWLVWAIPVHSIRPARRVVCARELIKFFDTIFISFLKQPFVLPTPSALYNQNKSL